MKIFRFMFSDFWRKLVALIFAVVIYWQAGGFARKSETSSAPPKTAAAKEDMRISIKEESSREDIFPVGIIADGTGRTIAFAPGVEPRVTVTLCGDDLTGIHTGGDLRFYVDAAEFTQGCKTLRVRCHIRRAGVRVLSLTPETIEVVEVPVKKP